MAKLSEPREVNGFCDMKFSSRCPVSKCKEWLRPRMRAYAVIYGWKHESDLGFRLRWRGRGIYKLLNPEIQFPRPRCKHCVGHFLGVAPANTGMP